VRAVGHGNRSRGWFMTDVAPELHNKEISGGAR
jgi:hypothetical protein